MQLAFTEEQEELRRAARGFLAEQASSERTRAAMASESGHDEAVWKQLGAELGWTGVAIPEAFGGAGLGAVELVALLEEMGAVLLCAPFFSTVCLAAPALVAAGACAAQAEWLPAIAEGRATATLGFGGGGRDPATIGVTVRREGADYVLAGGERYVLDGQDADLLLVAARHAGSTGTAGVSLFAVPGATRGLERRAHVGMDQTRRTAALSCADLRLPAAALVGGEGEAWPALERALDEAAVALGAEQVGGAQRCLDMAVRYAGERVQFGRPIGSFQAIKHKCADMMVGVESSRSAVWYAACVAAEQRPELPETASLVKAWSSEAYFRCAAEALQIHGGVGFTWEYDVHLHLKRARAMESFLGTPAWHRERVAQRVGL